MYYNKNNLIDFRKNDVTMCGMDDVAKKASLIRKWSMIATTEAASGHPTSCLSAADLVTVLFDKHYTYDIKNPQNPNNDRFILSKGHASPLLYIAYAMAGAFPLTHLKTLRKINSDLEGHPTPNFKYAEAATGSLGQGLSVAAGMSYALRAENQKSNLKNQRLPKVYVLLGDGELAEGSVWEAANFASYYKLNNLIAIADINRFGQSQETMFGHHIDEYIQRFSAFGWEVIAIDGHDFAEIGKAFELGVNNKSDKPFIIIAKTKKGKGISFLEDKDGWHGKPLKKDDLEKALKELGNVDDGLQFEFKNPKQVILVSRTHPESSISADSGQSQNDRNLLSYKLGEEIGTREVYGKVLAELGKENPAIYSLDAEVKNSTYAMDFKAVHPERYVECFIAEQNMVGVALGLSKRKKIPFVSTFAAFLTRAFDQIRMSVVSKGNIKFVGSHAGVSIGEDGASQMGLEDIAMFGVLPDTVVLHPSDAVSTAALLPLLVEHNGISYLRTLRPKTPVIYNNKEKFTIGGSKILRSAQNDRLSIVAAGITVFEALKAYELLKKDGITVRVIDCYSIKPIDKKTLLESLQATKKNILITVEDHFSHGGLGDFVLSAVSDTGARVEKMAVTQISHSGTKEELLDLAGISAKHIVRKVKNLV